MPMIKFSEPINAILHVKRDFADMIKTKNPEEGRRSWIDRPNLITGVL